jgi:uncharacterized protein (TIGR02145 family)
MKLWSSIIAIIFFTWNSNLYAQFIENIDFFAEGNMVEIVYDLTNCQSNEKYNVSLVFKEQNSNKIITPTSISGDIKYQNCGKKRITWDIDKDEQNISGNFYPELKLVTSPNGPVDVDGYKYKTVKIGAQEWFAENLRTKLYNDGSPIEMVTDDKLWANITTGAWCYYNNDPSKNSMYGKLYNWYSVNRTTNDNKNICPTGWKVPSDIDWNILVKYLGDEKESGGKMKEVGTNHWTSPNTDATNSSLFTALPGGFRYDYGDFFGFGVSGFWWSSSENYPSGAWFRFLNGFEGASYKGNDNKRYGFSIRCIKE